MTVPIVKSRSFSNVSPASMLNSVKGIGQGLVPHSCHTQRLQQDATIRSTHSVRGETTSNQRVTDPRGSDSVDAFETSNRHLHLLVGWWFRCRLCL